MLIDILSHEKLIIEIVDFDDFRKIRNVENLVHFPTDFGFSWTNGKL